MVCNFLILILFDFCMIFIKKKSKTKMFFCKIKMYV